MNTVNSKLAKIKELGLSIDDDNCNYVIGSDKAEDYANEYLVDRPEYVLGSVIADTESLQTAEYNVCFSVIESSYDNLISDYYHSLHELAEGNDAVAFIEYLQALHNQHGGHGGDTVYRKMADDVVDYMTDIENELDEIILGLGGNINE